MALYAPIPRIVVLDETALNFNSAPVSFNIDYVCRGNINPAPSRKVVPKFPFNVITAAVLLLVTAQRDVNEEFDQFAYSIIPVVALVDSHLVYLRNDYVCIRLLPSN